MAQKIKNVFANQDLMGWLNGIALHINQMGNEVAKAYKGEEYHVGDITFIQVVQLLTNIDVVKNIISLKIDDYREHARSNSEKLFTKTKEANRGIWYEFGMFTSALDTIFRTLDTIYKNPDAFREKGTHVSPKEVYEAGKARDFYFDAFRKLRAKCLSELTENEATKYYRFID